jgi:hypothetical protein
MDDFNISCHSNEDNNTFFLDRDIHLQHYKLRNQVQFDKNCAIISGQDEFCISDYILEIKKCVKEWKPCHLHSQCQIYQIGIEKAIAKVHSSNNELSISLQKVLVIKSRIQANMKRDFL